MIINETAISDLSTRFSLLRPLGALSVWASSDFPTSGLGPPKGSFERSEKLRLRLPPGLREYDSDGPGSLILPVQGARMVDLHHLEAGVQDRVTLDEADYCLG